MAKKKTTPLQAPDGALKTDLSSILAHLPGMAYRCRNDENWTMAYVSEGGYALTGYLPEDLIANHKKSYAELIHPGDREMVWKEVQSGIKEKRPFIMKYRLIDAQGNEKWVWEQGSGIFSTDHELICIEGFITDITYQLKAQPNLIESEDRYSRLFESSHAVMLLAETDTGRIIDANPAACAYYGYSWRKIVSLKIGDLVASGQDEMQQQSTLSQSMRRGKFNLKHQLADGTVRNVEMYTGPLTYKGKNLIYCILHDVTEQYIAEHELRDKLTRLEIMKAIHDRMQMTMELEDLFKFVGENLPKFLNVSQVSLAILDENAQVLLWEDHLKDRWIKLGNNQGQPLGYSISGKAVQEVRPIAIDDCRKSDIIPQEFIDASGFKSVLAIPILSHNKPIGCMRIDYCEEYHHFTSGEIEFYSMLGDQLGVIIDNIKYISQIKQAEETLRTRENRYRQAIELAEAVPYQKEYKDNSFSYVGDTIERLTGLTPQQLTREKWVSMIKEVVMRGEGAHYDIDTALDKSRSGDLVVWQSDVRIEDARGETRWFSDSSIPIMGNDGKPTGSLGILQDITERKKTEEEFQKLYRAVEQSPAVVVITDTQGNIEYVNPAFTRRTGYTPEEVLGKNPRILKGGVTAPIVYQELWNTLLAGKEWRGVFCNKKKNGDLFWENAIISPVKNKEGIVTNYLAVKEDITLLREAERRNSILGEMGKMLSGAATVQEAGEIVLEAADHLVGWDCAFVDMYLEQEHRLNTVIAYDLFNGERRSFPDNPTSAIGPLSQKAIDQGPLLILRTNEEIEKINEWLPMGNRSKPSKSLMFIPLKKGEKLLGILSLQSYKAKAYDDRALESVLLLADQCAVALERSFAQTKLQEREEMLQRQLSKTTALRNIDLSITSTLDVRVNLNLLLQQLVNELKVDAAVILLMNPVTGVMEFMEGIGFRTRALQYTRLRIGEGLAGKAALTRSIVSIPDLRTHPNELSKIPSIINERFVMYMGIPLIAKGQVKGVMEIFHRRLMTPDQEWQDFLEALATQAAIAIDNASLFDNLQRSNLELLLAYDTTLEGWSRAMDLRDKETEGHTQRVTEKTLELAQAMDVSEKELGNIRWGALLHDMGKMGIPDSILLKPGPLTDEEWVIMKKHPVYAYELLSPIAYLRPALDIPYCHHEKWDGTGYPRGIQGEAIPISARIFSVVDVWDALTSDRPYRKAWSADKTKEYILSISGTQFDPRVVEGFMKMNW